MLRELRLPDLGEGVTEGEVVEWLVAEGDRVDEDTPLLEVMTDKASVQIPSPLAGTVASLCVAAGDRVPVGTVLLRIEGVERVAAGEPRAVGGDGAAPIAEARPAPANGLAAEERLVAALPSTRRLARELGVDLRSLQGTGRHGRVTDDDVRAAGRTDAQAPAAGTDRVPAAGRVEVAGRADATGLAVGAPAPSSPSAPPRRIPFRGRRRAIAERLTRAAAVPTVTIVEEAELDRLDALRRRIQERDGVRLTYLPFVVRAAAWALRRMPLLNSHLDEEAEEIVVEPGVDIGIAVDTDDGLVVPVVRGADGLDVHALAAAVERLSAAARDGSVAAEDLRGGTFTVSSPGRWGGLMATPIINGAQAAILGVHRAEPRPVVREGQVVVRTMANLSLTFDHRIVDGVTAARFLRLVVDAVEEPALPAVGELPQA